MMSSTENQVALYLFPLHSLPFSIGFENTKNNYSFSSEHGIHSVQKVKNSAHVSIVCFRLRQSKMKKAGVMDFLPVA